MKSECTAVSLDLFSWLLTSFPELGESWCFDASEVECACSQGEENGQEPNSNEGAEMFSSAQPQVLSVKTEALTTGCSWRDYFE